MSSAVHAYGTLLKAGDGASPETFTTIAEVRNGPGLGFSVDDIEVTNHDSTNAWKEFIPGLLDAGEVSFSINFLPTNATHSASAGILNDMQDRTVRNFQLVMSDGSSATWNFTGYYKGFNANFPPESQIEAEVTIKVTGEPTLA